MPTDAREHLKEYEILQKAYAKLGIPAGKWQVFTISDLFDEDEIVEIYKKAWTKGVANSRNPYDCESINAFFGIFEYQPTKEVISAVFCQRYNDNGKRCAYDYLLTTSNKAEKHVGDIPIPKKVLSGLIESERVITWKGFSISKSEMCLLMDTNEEFFIRVAADIHNVLRLWPQKKQD